MMFVWLFEGPVAFWLEISRDVPSLLSNLQPQRARIWMGNACEGLKTTQKKVLQEKLRRDQHQVYWIACIFQNVFEKDRQSTYAFKAYKSLCTDHILLPCHHEEVEVALACRWVVHPQKHGKNLKRSQCFAEASAIHFRVALTRSHENNQRSSMWQIMWNPLLFITYELFRRITFCKSFAKFTYPLQFWSVSFLGKCPFRRLSRSKHSYWPRKTTKGNCCVSFCGSNQTDCLIKNGKQRSLHKSGQFIKNLNVSAVLGRIPLLNIT